MSIKKIKYLIKKIIPTRYHPFIRQSIRNIISLAYLGSKFQCPICKLSLRKFQTYNKRSKAQCPRCGCMERHRLLHLYLQNETTFYSSNINVLHIAPEQSLRRIWMARQNIHYISADLSSPIADIMRELHRVLKPNGCAILNVPIDKNRERTFEDTNIKTPWERELIFGQDDHVRIYGLDYKNRLEESGFVVNIVSFNDKLGLDAIEKYGLVEPLEIWICSK